MRIIITADLHLHSHRDFDVKNPESLRLQEGLDVLEWLFEEASCEKAEKIIIAGDLFHKRHVLGVKNFNKVYDDLKFLCNHTGIDCIILAGNHDQSSYADTSIHLLGAIKGVQVIEHPTRVKLDSTFFMDFMPYYETGQEFLAGLQKLWEKNTDTSTPRHLICHQAVFGAMASGFEYVPEYALDVREIPEKYDIILSGHYHQHQMLADGRFMYLGAPMQHHRGDAGDLRGIWSLDTETHEIKRIPNNISPVFIASPPTEELIQSGNMHRCIFFFEVSSLEEKLHWEAQLDAAGVRGYDISVVPLGVETPTEVVQHISSPVKLFESYVEEQADLSLEAVEIGRDLLQRAVQGDGNAD